jgi:hypothetical protein
VKWVGEVAIEERSFVAKGAPLDDGQKRICAMRKVDRCVSGDEVAIEERSLVGEAKNAAPLSR